MNREIWKDIAGYEGLYQASNLGQIKTLSRVVFRPQSNLPVKERILKQQLNKNGYLQVTISVQAIRKCLYVHRLVLSAFKGQSNLDCNHVDGNKVNNRLDNLEFVTKSENSLHAYKTGLVPIRNMPKGIKHHRAKVTEEIVTEIRKSSTEDLNFICNKYNVSKSTYHKIKSKKSWRHI